MPELTEPVLPLPGHPEPAPEIPPPPENIIPAEPPPPVGDEPSHKLPDPTDVWTPLELPPVQPRTPTSSRLPISIWLTALLVPYAIVTTIGVAYLFQQRLTNKEPHILESIPDQGLYEDFLDGRRHEVIQTTEKAAGKTSNTKIIPPNEPINQDIVHIKLGETRRIGQLEITPQTVAKQPLRYSLHAGKTDVAGEEALVLKLQVKNVGPVIFRPDDETFNRALANDSKSPVYTFLEVGNDRYYGVINDPAHERLAFPVCKTLLPGETDTLHVVAVKNSDGKKQAASAIKPGEEYLWRVHLRRGKEEITLSSGKKRSVWLTTVVPIVFKASDVK